MAWFSMVSVTYGKLRSEYTNTTSEISVSQLKVAGEAEQCDEVYIIQRFTFALSDARWSPLSSVHLTYMLFSHYSLSIISLIRAAMVAQYHGNLTVTPKA